MRHLRALAVAVVAGMLFVGAGCVVSKTTYNRDVMAAQKERNAAQKQLDQAKRDLKAAQEQLKSKDQVVADFKSAENLLAGAKDRADRLQAELGEARKSLDLAKKDLAAETGRANKLQRDLDAQKTATAGVAALKNQLAAKEVELEAAKNALAEIAKKLGGAMPNN